MRMPFTTTEFFDVFRRYNEAVWPAQIALILLALLVAFAAYRANFVKSWRWAQIAFAGLAVIWIWAGYVFDKLFFAKLTPAGQIFGSFFIAQAGLLVLCLWENGGRFQFAAKSSLITGSVLIGYALLIYPAIGFVLGHRYPFSPTFGAPCPVTIFTFGVFCLLPAHVPRFALAIPVLWAVVGSTAAFEFGVREDFFMIVAAAAAIGVIHHDAAARRNAGPLRTTTA